MKCSYLIKRLLLATAVLTASVVSSSSGLAWSLTSQPVEGVLVLRNGNILRGKLQQRGKFYHVYMPNGELQIREQQVEMACQNIEEAYQRRREARAGSTADSHFELASWCLRHGLLDYAKAEIQGAQTTDPNHPRLALLQRQLKHSLQMEHRRKQQQQAKVHVTAEPAPLDPAAIEKAPQWARALFVRQIQPLVVHSCAAGGCHQSDSKSVFRLNRLAIDGAGHPETTLRNLAATLEQINWDAAGQSDLLVRAKRAHGALSASTPLPPHKLKVLQGWVEQLAEVHRKETELNSLQLVAALPPSPPQQTKTQLLPPQQQASQEMRGEIRTASYEPKNADPFDPSAFNSRYAKKAELAVEPAVPHVLVPDEPALIPVPIPVME